MVLLLLMRKLMQLLEMLIMQEVCILSGLLLIST